MSLSNYRPSRPEVHCSVCKKTPDKISDTAIHFDFPTKYGIIFIRVECHGQIQDIAATFKWCDAHRKIEAFKDDGEDYGLRDLAELDGFHLPKEYEHCMKQLQDRTDVDNVYGIDPIFLRALKREIDLHKAYEERTLDDVIDSIEQTAKELCSKLDRSKTRPVATGDITELCGRLAFVALKAFERFGTPKTQPTKMISTWKTVQELKNERT